MTGTSRKILLGCLGVVVGLVVLVVVAVGTFAFWITRPGEVIEPGRLLSADATGYAEWTLRADDPGTEGFLRLLFETVRGMSEEVNPSIPGFSTGPWGNDAAAFLPAVMAWTLHPPVDAAGEDLHLVSMSARGLGNQLVLADTIAGFMLARSRDPNVWVETHGGETIYRFRQPARDLDLTLFARRGAVFLTSHLDTARQAVDLLAASAAGEGASRPPSRLEQIFATTRDDHALRAAVVNGTGELARVWQVLSGRAPEMPAAWAAIEGAALTGGLQEDGSFAGTLRLLVPEATAAGAYGSTAPSTVTLPLATLDLLVELQPTVVDDGLEIGIRIPDAADAIASAMNARNRGDRGQRDF